MRIIIKEEIKKEAVKKAEEQKRKEKIDNLAIENINFNSVGEKYNFPTDGRIVRLFQLLQTRSAWHTTQTRNVLHTDFDVAVLQKLAEEKRNTGTSFLIEPKHGIWLKFGKGNLLLSLSLYEQENHSWYRGTLKKIEKRDLTNLFSANRFFDDTFMYSSQSRRVTHFSEKFDLYEVKNWRPDLLPNTVSLKYHSYITERGKKLGWKESEYTIKGKFEEFAKEFLSKLF